MADGPNFGPAAQARLDAAGLGCGPGDSMYRAAAARPISVPVRAVAPARAAAPPAGPAPLRSAIAGLDNLGKIGGAAAVRKAPPMGARPVSTTGTNPLRYAPQERAPARRY